MPASEAKINQEQTKENKFQSIKETKSCADSNQEKFCDFLVFASKIATIPRL